MAEDADLIVADEPVKTRSRARSRTARQIVAGTALAAVLAMGIGWSVRERLANRIIADQLDTLKLRARYTVTSIGAGEQVISDVMLGDPAKPDLTIDAVIVSTGLRGGLPGITGVTLVRPRFHGTLKDGHLSFGSLDALFKGPSGGRMRLPDIALSVIDGKGTIDADGGAVGLALAGDGPLRDGFSGTIGASWPGAQWGHCRADKAVLAGRLSVRAEQPGLDGPVDLDRLDCGGTSLRHARLDISAAVTPGLDGVSAQFALAGGAFRSGGWRSAGVGGNGRTVLTGTTLTTQYRLALSGVTGGGLIARRLGIEGVMRGDPTFSSLTAEGEVNGEGLAPDAAALAALDRLGESAKATLAGPLLAQARRELAGLGKSVLEGRYVLRRQGTALSVVAPQLRLRRGRETVLELARAGVARSERGTVTVTGRFQGGATGLPAFHGRIDGGDVHLSVAEYRAGGASIAVPKLALHMAGGKTVFAGTVLASGALPGGSVRNLQLPVSGEQTSRGLALGRACMPVKFERLQLASLELDRQAVTVCPQPGRAMLLAGPRGVRIAAGATGLAVHGQLAGTPVRIASGPIGFAWPGTIAARALDIALGPMDRPSRFRISGLTARLGGEIGGRFEGADVSLAAVPLDLHDAAGDWRYGAGSLVLDKAAFRLVDREPVARFEPLVARDASLALANDRITANAVLREPLSGRAVSTLALRHDLGSGYGQARLGIDGLVFDNAVQPDTLSKLALGVVANVEGAVSGEGVIDWSPSRVASHGRFSTDRLDLAAAFGPVEGLSGTVAFSDLLGLVTSPGQTLRIARINPGIPVEDGTLRFAMLPGHVLAVEGAEWPFLDGRLELLPTRMTLGAAEVRRYVLRVTGISAARFVERMELSNLAATGTFDGELPLVFDQHGGWVRGGRLVSRTPGGNVSYVGDLSYKDLSAVANFAFQTLRDLDYRSMTIGMDGPLAGELVTRVSMSGVTQGKGAKRNFVTRQLGRLPIRFDVNVRAPFFDLVTSFKSLYDPHYLRSAVEMCLIDLKGNPISAPNRAQCLATGIQPPVSETRP